MADLTSEMATAFERHEREIGLQRLRLGCWIAIPLTIAGALIDYFSLSLDTPAFKEFFAARLLFSAAIVPILWLSGQSWGARHLQTLGIALAMAPAACMAYIVYRDLSAAPYYAGLNLVLLGVALVMQWSLRQSLITAVLLILMYLTAVFLPGSASFEQGGFIAPPEVWRTLQINCWFLLLTSVIAVIGSHVSYRLRVSDFQSRWNLDRSRQELEGKNKKLREMDEVKGRFFANISHELRTPLTLLLGPLEQLRANPRLVEDPRVREYLDTMNDNGLRLLKLINDLLDLVRLDAGRLRLNRVNVEVASFTRGLMNSIRRFAEDRGLRVTCEIQGGLRQVVADPDKLEKVFLNLLFNSIKFTPAGGEVRLAGHQDGEFAVFRITDTGVGMSAENMARLFERFWQADTSAHRKHQGAGIGLALVKELVEAHGGTVVAQSELGKGTTMTVRLPVGAPLPATEGTSGVPAVAGAAAGMGTGEGRAAPAPAPATPAPVPAERVPEDLSALYRRAELYASITPLRESLRPWNPTRGGGHPLVLVVDDEPDMLRFLRSQVEDDYEVREAVDGNQATVLAAQYLPDAVVCDMMLPEKDGMQVCRELRANHSTRSIPFLMLTARADDETKLAALAAGASDFLPKPFSSAELKLRLKNLVDARRLQKELSRQNKQLESTLEELRETETQLVQAEKMASLGRLSAGIIHEINNPLNFTRTGLHILTRMGKDLPEAVREEFEEVLRDMAEGITRVSTIVGDLRQFSHPENSVLDDVDADATLEAALRFLSVEWKDGRVEIVNEIPDGFTVRANRNKLVQVVLNICQNAFDAMREHPPKEGKPRLHLRGWAADGRRRLAIRDNGPGIPAHHLAHIFEPFYTTKEIGKGMGLGLSICYRLMEEAGGRISVNTETGRFCEFVLEFPERLQEKAEDKRESALATA